MHGRVKVRTTEEEKARKLKDRQAKLKVFMASMQKVNLMRNNNQLDSELLDITGQILSFNPDISTLWNIRREVLIVISKAGGDNDSISGLFDAELSLTEYCLKSNPKSYCAWHQREWVLTTRTDPDWKKELYLCDKYLKFDERNFHTWDYRRFIVSQCKPSLKDEFDFTTDKIFDNFSNYSAWHYRSKMLIQLYPDLKGGRPIEDTHHKHELKLVQSAAFTDPNDTSAWFYQQWLLSAVKDTTQMVVCAITPEKASLAFNKCVPHTLLVSKILFKINGAPQDCEWVSCTGNSNDSLWICKLQDTITDDMNIEVELISEDHTQVINCVNTDKSTYIGKTKINFKKQYSEAVIEELKTQLEGCRQLQQLEPDSKWTLLTTTVFLHCIDPKQYHEESINNLQLLTKIDKLRSGYYQDLMSKWSIEENLLSIYETDKNNVKFDCIIKFTSLPHLQYLSYCKEVDMSNQSLMSHSLSSLVKLQHCKILNLENNKITTLKSFPNMDLEFLNLKGNNIDSKELESFKQRINYEILF